MSNDLQSRTIEVIVVNAVLLSISCLVVSLRLASRWLSAARFWWDDACIILSLVLLCGSSTFNFFGAANGAGKHIVTPAQGLALHKIIYGSEILYGPHITSIKTSILLLYLRIFGIRKPFKVAILVVEAFVVAWCVAILLIGIFQANPISAIWKPEEPHTQINYDKYLLATAVPNVVTDFVILILPIPMVWQLQISARRKIALCGVFLLGTFVCGASIVRAYVVSTIDEDDATYEYANTLVWSSVEVNIGVICACLPVLQPVIHRLLGDLLGSSKYSQSSSTTSWQKNDPPHSGPANTSSTAPFRRLDDEVIKAPLSAVNDTCVSAGAHNDESKAFGLRSQSIPLNAIHVQKNVDLANEPKD